jgi:hypothetical protein
MAGFVGWLFDVCVCVCAWRRPDSRWTERLMPGFSRTEQNLSQTLQLFIIAGVAHTRSDESCAGFNAGSMAVHADHILMLAPRTEWFATFAKLFLVT